MKKNGWMAVLLCLLPLTLFAGGEEVVVVYNSVVPESKAVAEHYADLRHVPQKQVYGFAMPVGEEISRDEFHDSIQRPLLKKLESQGLWVFGPTTFPATNGQPARTVERVIASKIRYAVLCYGVPLKIAPDVNLHEPVNPMIRGELRRNEAAVDSELAWLPMAKMNVPATGPLPNWTYTATNTALLDPTNGVLLVARIDGPTPEIASNLVDKAMEAERDGFWGRAYFDARGLKPADTNYILGDQWILTAAEVSRRLGFEINVDTNNDTYPASFPMSQVAVYVGWYADNANGPFAEPAVEFMPGAFAYHLHSFSASTLRSPGANWCGPLLTKGATCTMGCVYEPYLALTPNVAFCLQALGNGYTFGEATLASQPAVSWQTTVIGDPLYRPFGKRPDQLHAELTARHSPLIEWSFLRLVNLDIVRGVPEAQLATFIENLPVTTNSAVLMEKLADIYDAQGKPSAAIDTYARVLRLKPTPEQRIRIRFTLGEKLRAAREYEKAYENYQLLLEENPRYPGRPLVYQQLLTLAKTLGKTQDAKRYEAMLK